MEEALKLHNWPDELYKFRGRGGMAVYHHIELNIYEDTTCQNHSNCRISVKKVDDHYELDELVNESAKQHSYCHEPYEGPKPHLYIDKDEVLRTVIEWQIEYSSEKIAEYEKKLSEAEDYIKKNNKLDLKHQTIDRLDFESEIVVLRSLLRLKQYELMTIEYKVSNKDGVQHLQTRNGYEVKNRTDKQFLEVTCGYYDDDSESYCSDDWLGFCSMDDYKTYCHNKEYKERLRDVNMYKSSIEHHKKLIEERKEKLEKIIKGR